MTHLRHDDERKFSAYWRPHIYLFDDKANERFILNVMVNMEHNYVYTGYKFNSREAIPNLTNPLNPSARFRSELELNFEEKDNYVNYMPFMKSFIIKYVDIDDDTDPGNRDKWCESILVRVDAHGIPNTTHDGTSSGHYGEAD